MSHSTSEPKLQYVVCPVCGEGILDIVAEIGIEAEGDREKFQSLSSAHGKVYKCDKCGKSFVKVNDKFLEIKPSE
ncbi:MAG: hypothetical protein ACM3JQ_05845 [Candidatus Eiseniibacteriota bacterium]